MAFVYKVIDSPVGLLKLVASDKGLAAILWESDSPRRMRVVPLTEDPNNPILLETERQLYYERHRAVLAYARANSLTRSEVGARGDRVGLVTAGKSHGDLRQALLDLGPAILVVTRMLWGIGIALYGIFLLSAISVANGGSVSARGSP